MVEVRPGAWRKAHTLNGEQAERAREVALEKGQLTHEIVYELLPQLAGHSQIVRIPERWKRAAEAGELPSAPVALAVLRDQRRQVKALVDELDSGEAV